MKKILAIIAFVSFAFAIQSCNSKPKDEDVKVAAEKVLAADPSCSGIAVSVNDGVATLTGEVKDDATRTMAQTAVAGVKGVKTVQNNTTVYVPPPPVMQPSTPTPDESLTKSVNDAIKDYPGVVATVKDQKVTLTGEIKKSDVQKLMMSLNSLKPMGLKSIDSKGLVKK